MRGVVLLPVTNPVPQRLWLAVASSWASALPLLQGASKHDMLVVCGPASYSLTSVLPESVPGHIRLGYCEEDLRLCNLQSLDALNATWTSRLEPLSRDQLVRLCARSQDVICL